MRVVLLFLDGVGIGRKDPSINPFFSAELPTFRHLLDGAIPHTSRKRISSPLAELVPVNATLGIAGLPQSGTGQTALFTGVNGAKVFGRHFGPYPPTTLRPLIEAKNIFLQVRSLGKSVCFANAFPQRFFDYTHSGTRRLTVTTLACMMTGVPILTARELVRNEGISADFTRSRWPELGHPEVHPVTPREAGKHLWGIAARHDLTLFEYWLTDVAGHSQDMKTATNALEHLDAFLGGFLEQCDGKNTLLVIISDHGNIEDLSTKSHTRNPVPCIAVGAHRKQLTAGIRNLTHLTPTVLRILSES